MGAEDNGHQDAPIEQPKHRGKLTVTWNLDGTVSTDHPIDVMVAYGLLEFARKAVDRFFDAQNESRLAKPGPPPMPPGLGKRLLGPFGKPNHG